MTCPHCNYEKEIQNEHLLFDDAYSGGVYTQYMLCNNCMKPFIVRAEVITNISYVPLSKEEYIKHKKKYDDGHHLILK